MDNNVLILFIVGVVVVTVIGFCLKSFAKLIICLAVIALLFKLGFVWGPNDLNEKLHLDKVLNLNHKEKVLNAVESFSDKRELNEIVDPEKVGDVFNEAITDGAQRIGEKVKDADVDKILKDLKNKI